MLPFPVTLILPLPPSLIPGKNLSEFCIYNIVTLRMVHTWNHRVCDFLRLFPLSKMTLKSPTQTGVSINSLFVLIAGQYPMGWMYQSLFNHSTIEGNFGYYKSCCYEN